MSSIYFTLGCTLSNVSFPPAGWQTPQCRHNAEQSLVSRVESGILVRTGKKKLWNEQLVAKRRPGRRPKLSAAYTLAPAMLPNCSWRMESTFHTVEEKAWGFSMRMEQPLWGTEEVENVRSRRASTGVDSKGWRTLKSTFCTRQCAERISYLVEVPHRVGQSSPGRVVCLPHPVGVAGDVQVHAVLDVLLAVTCTFQDFDCIPLSFVVFLSVTVAIVSNDHKSAQWVNDPVD